MSCYRVHNLLMFKRALLFLSPYFNSFKVWTFAFLRRRKRRFIRSFENSYENPYKRQKKMFRWIFYLVFAIKTKATPRNILKFIRWSTIRFGGFIKSSLLIIFFENYDYPHLDTYFKINLALFFCLKYFQERVYNFRCPVAYFIFGELDMNIKRHPRTIAKMEAEKKKKEKKKPDWAIPPTDPFYNKKERIKQIAKAQAEFEMKVAANREVLKLWREKRRPIKKELVIAWKIIKRNRKRRERRWKRWLRWL